MEESEDTRELRLRAERRERAERELAAETTPEEAEAHERRAEKSSYLREKLAERERAERDAD